MRHFVFPYEEVDKKAKIIIYGVGGVGKQYISQLLSKEHQQWCADKDIQILFAVDQNGYYNFTKIHEVSVYEPAKIKETSVDDYDAIVIAVESHQTAQVIMV